MAQLLVATSGYALAGINSTILAILIAAFVGYLLIVHRSIDRLEHSVIEAANTPRSIVVSIGSHSLQRLTTFRSWTCERWHKDARGIGALDRYRRRVLTLKVRLAAWAFVLLVFVSGVAIPMVAPSVTTVLSAWLPAVAYTSCLVLGGVALSLKALEPLAHPPDVLVE